MSDPSEHPSGSPLPELARGHHRRRVRLAAATAAWLRLVAEFDTREGWHGVGIKSCAHWLAWQCGLSPGAAREHVRVARALRVTAVDRGGVRRGRLSYSKVRALTRIAEPDTEASLLELALELTASQVERTVRQWRRAEPAQRRRPSRRPAGSRSTTGGTTTACSRARMRMATEGRCRFLAAIESLVERDARRERARRRRRAGRASRRRADRTPTTPGAALARERAPPAASPPSAGSPRRRPTPIDAPADPPRREVVVHVDAAVLADDAAAGRAYLEGGPALAPATPDGCSARRPS